MPDLRIAIVLRRRLVRVAAPVGRAVLRGRGSRRAPEDVVSAVIDLLREKADRAQRRYERAVAAAARLEQDIAAPGSPMYLVGHRALMRDELTSALAELQAVRT